MAHSQKINIDRNTPKEERYRCLTTYRHLSSGVARLFPTKADRKIAKKLNVKVKSPLFLIEQEDTDQVGRPVVYSREYFVSEYFNFVIYRRRKK